MDGSGGDSLELEAKGAPLVQCPITGDAERRLVKRFDQRPEGETDFGAHPYSRELWQFLPSGHFVNVHDLNVSYDGAYAASTYAGLEGMRTTFDRIVALPTERSDNAGRVGRVNEHRPGKGRVLDIGSGLGVFPYEMQRAGWTVTALDPDPLAAEHMQQLSLEVIEADFMTADLPERFDLVTLNKVLEHVLDPVPMLAKAGGLLAVGGALYFEVPDGEGAMSVGADREEFFIEHWHAFSMKSALEMTERAGLMPLSLERLREPSGKFTIRVFCR